MFSRFDDDDSGTLSFGECFCLIPELEKAIVQSARQDDLNQKLKSVSILAGSMKFQRQSFNFIEVFNLKCV